MGKTEKESEERTGMRNDAVKFDKETQEKKDINKSCTRGRRENKG